MRALAERIPARLLLEVVHEVAVDDDDAALVIQATCDLLAGPFWCAYLLGAASTDPNHWLNTLPEFRPVIEEWDRLARQLDQHRDEEGALDVLKWRQERDR